MDGLTFIDTVGNKILPILCQEIDELQAQRGVSELKSWFQVKFILKKQLGCLRQSEQGRFLIRYQINFNCSSPQEKQVLEKIQTKARECCEPRRLFNSVLSTYEFYEEMVSAVIKAALSSLERPSLKTNFL